MRRFARASSATAVVVLLAFGAFSGLLVTPAAAACPNASQIWGPIPVHAEVTKNYVTSYFDGSAETYKAYEDPPFCVEVHRLHVWGAFQAENYYNNNVFWLLWLPSGMTLTYVRLDSDEWVAQGGVGHSYVFIGQFPGIWGTRRYPDAREEYIPNSFWGQNFYISMRMAYNTWDCSSPFATCGGVQSYLLVG